MAQAKLVILSVPSQMTKRQHDQWPEIASQVGLFVSAATVKAASAARHTGLNSSDIVFVSVTSNALHLPARLDSAL